MKTVQIINLSRKKLLETTEEIFSNEDLLLYANIKKNEIAKRFLGNKIVKPVTLNFVGGSVAKPADWNGHYFTKDSLAVNQGTEYKLVNQEDFQAGRYSQMITESEQNILCYPAQNVTLYTWYYKKLTDMALVPTIVEPPYEIDDIFHMCIVYAVVSNSLEDGQDFELSKYFADKSENEYQKSAETISQLEESSQEASVLLNQLPDLNFSRSGYNPNYF